MSNRAKEIHWITNSALQLLLAPILSRVFAEATNFLLPVIAAPFKHYPTNISLRIHSVCAKVSRSEECLDFLSILKRTGNNQRQEMLVFRTWVLGFQLSLLSHAAFFPNKSKRSNVSIYPVIIVSIYNYTYYDKYYVGS